MRITIVTTKLDFNGGGGKFDILLTAQALLEKGYEVRVVTAFSESNNISEEVAFEVCPEQVSSKRLMSMQIFIVSVLKKYAASTDVFYLIGGAFLPGAGWYRRFSVKSKPVVVHLNGYTDFIEDYFKRAPLWPDKYLTFRQGWLRGAKHRLRIFLERLIGVYFINKLDAITVYSEGTANYYLRAGLAKNKTSVLLSFHDILSLINQPLKNNPFSDCPKDSFHILSVSRFYIDKGADLLIDAFGQAKLPNAILHLVGDGPQEEELKKIVGERDLSSSVKFYPWQKPDDLAAFYQHADLFVYPARLPEAMVRTSVEAMALGVPLVVPDTSAQSWVGEVAKIFKNGDVADLKDKLEQAYGDKEFREKAHLIGPKLALDYDYRRLVIQLENILLKYHKNK